MTIAKQIRLESLAPEEAEFFKLLVGARKQMKLTQKQIAVRMRTTASAVARIESAGGKKRHSPSLRTMHSYANAVGCEIKISLVPQKPEEQ